MNSQNCSLNSHLLKFVSLCNDVTLDYCNHCFFLIGLLLVFLNYTITSYSHANKAYVVVVDMSYEILRGRNFMEGGNLSLVGRRPVSRHADHVYPRR